MPLKADTLALDVLDADPISPNPGELWWSTPTGLGPKATALSPGFMSLTDKSKLDNMSANGSGDDWVSGLAVTAHPPNNQTVDYSLGTYMINGVIYAIASGGVYNLANGFGGVNHYTALAAGQRAIVLIYLDVAQAIKSIAGTASSSAYPAMPAIPVDTACLSFVLISKNNGGVAKNITANDLTDCRFARRAQVDEAVKVSANDTTSGFLQDKLSANGNVIFTKENTDANETLKADVQFGTSATTACVGNDSRLSNDRTASGIRTATTVVDVSAATAPIAGKVLTATSGTAATWQTPSGSVDANALHVNAGSEISALTAKATPVSADMLVIEDSAAANAKKKITIGSLPMAAMTSAEATATGTITTTSASDVLMTSMTNTPGAGTYLVMFSTSLSHTSSSGATYVSLYGNGSQVAASERRLTYTDLKQIGQIVPLATQAVITVAYGQAIEAKWRTSGSTASAYQRTLTLLKIA
jgi:hypothetical protein